jgi:hypothetical protein
VIWFDIGFAAYSTKFIDQNRFLQFTLKQSKPRLSQRSTIVLLIKVRHQEGMFCSGNNSQKLGEDTQ